MKAVCGLAMLWLGGLVTGVGQEPVSPVQIQEALSTPDRWLTQAGVYAGWHYSGLNEISPATVKQLTVAWVYQSRGAIPLNTTPLMVHGILYASEAPGSVLSLDVRTGRPFWGKWLEPAQKQDTPWQGRGHQGLALLEDRVYVATRDATLLALDAASGVERWRASLGAAEDGYACSHAPLALAGKVVVGVHDGRTGARGFLDAYEAGSGRRLWRLETVLGPQGDGEGTWSGESWKTGGTATDATGSYDSELNLIYWGTSSPTPVWNGDDRQGDNLYSSSLLAVDADTGALRWHFQFTPHDVHGWGAMQQPLLIDSEEDGRIRKCVVMANRNGFYYVLDRVTGAFIRGVPFARQTWARSLDEKGRPILVPGSQPTEDGVQVFPGPEGAVSGVGAAYSPQTGWIYLPVREAGSYYYKISAQSHPGRPFLGGGYQWAGGDETYGAIRALHALSGEKQWEFRLFSPATTGMLATSGGLVFGGTEEGQFFALDARTGEALWDFQTGGPIRSNPVAFTVAGRQHIAVAAGHALFVFRLP